MTLDHAGCSELLGPLLAGGLDAPRRSAVEEHLQTCTECGAELRALRAMVALEDAELNPEERARLRTAVTPATRRAARWSRLIPAFAAAAIVALGVVAYTSLGVSDDADLSTAGETTERDAPAVADEAEDRDRRGAPAVEAATGSASGGTDTGAAAAGGIASDDAAKGRTSNALDVAAMPQQAPVTFAHTVLEPTLLVSGPNDLDRITQQVPSRWRAQLDTCTRRLFASQPVTLTLAFARAFPRDDLLVAGYTWSESPSKAATHYAFWGWWRGDCDSVSPVFMRGTL